MSSTPRRSPGSSASGGKTSPSTVLVTPPSIQTPPKVKRTAGGLHARDLTPSTVGSNDDEDDSPSAGFVQTSFDSHTNGEGERTVVPYDEGATDLFLAIEECQWERALQITREQPGQTKVWIASTGSEDTVFSWNFWRRLPIHEACRRQPPPLLISSLLSAHPQSAYQTTHFGELPLHQAVGCGACPSVIDLLLASNYRGASTSDNGGRTPLEILDDFCSIREDSRMIKESLQRTVALLDREEGESELRLGKIQDEYEKRMEDMRDEHKVRLDEKDGVIVDLNREIERGDVRAADLSAQIAAREITIADKTSAERSLAERLQSSEDVVSDLMGKNRTLRKRVSDLDDAATTNETTIARLTAKVEELQSDLAMELSAQEAIAGEELVRVKVEMASLIKTQNDLATRITRQRDALKKKLERGGIDRRLPEPELRFPPRRDDDSSEDEQEAEELK